jgi:hypothetical protein
VTKPPAFATGLLLRLGRRDESFFGYLVDEYASGRSRAWYWRQVLGAILSGCARDVAAHPVRAVAAVATGWATLLLLFFALGDRTAESLAGWIWQWDRQTAYATQLWWPFQTIAVLVSYAGFTLSGLAVARLHRGHSGPMLIAYAVTVLLVLTASAVFLEVLIRRGAAVPVPHTLFYVISVALPSQWRTGLLLAPMVILGAGLIVGPVSEHRALSADATRQSRDRR